MKEKRFTSAFWAMLVVIALLSVVAWRLHIILNRQVSYHSGSDVEITIEKGMTLHQVAALLEEKRLIANRGDFRWAAWILRVEQKIQPGKFLLPRGVSNSQIIRYLLKPGILTRNVTIPEGLTVKQIAGILQRELNVDSTEFARLCQDSSFAGDLGIGVELLEGFLFPDTYNFYLDSTPRDIIERMVKQFLVVFDDSLRVHLQDVGMSILEAVTLASIIQGEFMIAEEAPLVSAVYHNRLKRGIVLAADPTIQYVISDGPRRLLNKDIEIDSPYNTYKYRGLPPGPVNNPGRIALEAAVRPAEVKYLYFVAKGDGSHAFNVTHSGHERDKAKFQHVRRKVARQKKASRINGR